MDKDELRQALDSLGWKQSELARKLGVTTSTVSRWATGEPIPVWLAEYLRVMQELDRLHRVYVKPPKPAKEAAPPVDTPAPRTETRAAAMVRTLAKANTKIADDAPITQADIDSGRLVLSKRSASYPVEVSWSDEDKGYIATLPDLPGCSAWGATEAEAIAQAHDASAAWIEAAKAAGRAIPEPTMPLDKANRAR